MEMQLVPARTDSALLMAVLLKHLGVQRWHCIAFAFGFCGHTAQTKPHTHVATTSNRKPRTMARPHTLASPHAQQ
jgi:hypothetical protein